MRLGEGGRHEWLGSLTLQVLLWIKNKISCIPAVTINQSMMHLVTPCPRGTPVSAKDYIKFLWSSYTLGWMAIYALCNTDQCIYTDVLNTLHIYLVWTDLVNLIETRSIESKTKTINSHYLSTPITVTPLVVGYHGKTAVTAPYISVSRGKNYLR